MATPLSPECRQLLRLLDNHEWHFVDEIMQKLAKQVSPGRAIRRYEQNSKLREEKYGPRVGPELSDQEKIASGARSLAHHAMTSMRKRYVELDDNGDVRLCRLRPEPLPIKARNIPRSLRIVDRADQAVREAALAAKRAESAAEESEEPPEPPSPPAASPSASPASMCPQCGLYVVNTAQHRLWHDERDVQEASRVEEAVRKVLAEELEGFRRGLQSFMIGRFAALEVVLGEQRRQARHW